MSRPVIDRLDDALANVLAARIAVARAEYEARGSVRDVERERRICDRLAWLEQHGYDVGRIWGAIFNATRNDGEW